MKARDQVYTVTVKSLKKVFFDKRTFIGALAFMFVLRVAYALTRDLFASGPDAPNYAVSPLDFAKYGFWSPDITGGAYYPQGYPFTLWPAAEIGGTHWVALASVFQIALSILTVFLVYKIGLLFLTKGMSLAVSYIFLFSPAFTPMSGQAMYEPVFMFFLFFYLYIVLRMHVTSYKYSGLIAGGLIGGFTCAIHPRALPWIAIIQVILFSKMGIQRAMTFFVSFLIPVGLFLLRNKIAEDTWSLSSATNVAMNWLQSKNLGQILIDGFWYGVHFWSPYSGDAKRGTWFHNFTFYHEMKKLAQSSAPVYIFATIFAVISIMAWLYGSKLLINTKPVLGLIVIAIPMLNFVTDIFTIGDSRHRLVVVPLLLIGQATFFRWLYERYIHKNRSWRP
jgi:hypothetical protein